MKSNIVFLCLVFGFVGSTFANEAAYKICVTCHAEDGSGIVAMNSPAIAGQEIWYLERQLNNFKTGLRGTNQSDIFGMQMRPMATTLATDEMVSSVAKYINAMIPEPNEKTVTGNAEAGKQLYATCTACHGADGKGIEVMNSPNLTIQQDWYLVRQLQNYKSGLRAYDPSDIYGQQMKPMAILLPDNTAINDVVAYINTLR